MSGRSPRRAPLPHAKNPQPPNGILTSATAPKGQINPRKLLAGATFAIECNLYVDALGPREVEPSRVRQALVGHDDTGFQVTGGIKAAEHQLGITALWAIMGFAERLKAVEPLEGRHRGRGIASGHRDLHRG